MAKIRKKFNWKIFCIVIACILVVYLIFALLPRTQCVKGTNQFVIEKGSRPLLIAHGGGHGEFPDNTLEACYNAYSVDPNVMLEMDVSKTKDNVIIMSHDTTLDRRTSASGAIADWNYTDLVDQRVDFGYLNEDKDGNLLSEKIKFKDFAGKEVTPKDVPNYPNGLPNRDTEIFKVTTLEDVLRAFPHNTVNVEIKQNGETGMDALRLVVELMDKLKAEFADKPDEMTNPYERVVLASFHNKIYKELKKIQKTTHPELMCSPEYVGVGTLLISGALGLDALYAEPVAVLQIPMSLSIIHLEKKWFVNAAHKHNIAVHYWTIDDEDDMRYLIEIGADGIMTNLPHTLQKVYDEVFGVQGK